MPPLSCLSGPPLFLPSTPACSPHIPSAQLLPTEAEPPDAPSESPYTPVMIPGTWPPSRCHNQPLPATSRAPAWLQTTGFSLDSQNSHFSLGCHLSPSSHLPHGCLLKTSSDRHALAHICSEPAPNNPQGGHSAWDHWFRIPLSHPGFPLPCVLPPGPGHPHSLRPVTLATVPSVHSVLLPFSQRPSCPQEL